MQLTSEMIKRFYTRFYHTEVHRNWKSLWRKAYKIETVDHQFINLNRMRSRVNFHSLKRFCLEFTPLHLYMSVLNFLFPERLAEKSKLNKSYPISGEYVVDIDAYLCYEPHRHFTEPEGVCLGCLSLAKKQTHNLLDKVEERYDDVHIVFSGRSGFHVHVQDFQIRDWTHYSVDNPQKSYEVARLKYTKQLQNAVPKIFDKHHFTLSVDTQRVITFPESLNGETGLVCSYLGRPDEFRDMTIDQIVTKARSAKHITTGLNWISADVWRNPRYNLLTPHPEPITDGQ